MDRCRYYKWFGYVSKMLRVSVLRDERGVDACLRSLARSAISEEK